MSFKSVFDSYLDRRNQSAQQEVEFARAVAQARQTAAAEDRARTALNLGIAEYNNKLHGLARRNAIEEATMPSILQRLGYNTAINEQVAQTALRSAAVKNALSSNDLKTVENLTGLKVRINQTTGNREFSRDNGANWFLENGMDSAMAALNNQVQVAAANGQLRIAEGMGKAQVSQPPQQSQGPMPTIPTLDPREARRFGVPQGAFNAQPSGVAAPSQSSLSPTATPDVVDAARRANMVIQRRSDGVYASPNGFDGWVKIQDIEEQAPFGFSDMQAP